MATSTFSREGLRLLVTLETWLTTRFKDPTGATAEFIRDSLLDPGAECRLVFQPMLHALGGRYGGDRVTPISILHGNAIAAAEEMETWEEAAWGTDHPDEYDLYRNEVRAATRRLRKALAGMLVEIRMLERYATADDVRLCLYKFLIEEAGDRGAAWREMYAKLRGIVAISRAEDVRDLVKTLAYGVAAFNIENLRIYDGPGCPAWDEWVSLASGATAAPAVPVAASVPTRTLSDFDPAKVEKVRKAQARARAEANGPYRREDVYAKAKIRRDDAKDILNLLEAEEHPAGVKRTGRERSGNEPSSDAGNTE